MSTPSWPTAASGHANTLDNLVQRVNVMVDHTSACGSLMNHDYMPQEPVTLRDSGLTEGEVEALILKLLLSRDDQVGRDIAEHIRLPFALVEPRLRQMKTDQLVVYRAAAPMNDYLYQLTELGRERARRLAEHCTYFGAAPVPLADYLDSVKAQSLTKQHPTRKDLERAFADLLVPAKMLARLGPAISSGRGMFLYGSPGNGKTSIAERVTRAFGEYIWIPRALGVDGDIVRLFDPMLHEEVPRPKQSSLYDHSHIDTRWVRVRRPTIVAGGELTMSNLEVAFNSSSGLCEAPLQLKSNCGVLVIDDFGRQRMSIEELMNRWIVPLEKRHDYLNLPKGKRIQVPFDQLIVFSTNLEPRDLVDESFLRRIPYKIEVEDPSEEEYRLLLKRMCAAHQIAFRQEAVDHLVQQHYVALGRPFRYCHARDLLLQVRNYCTYHRLPLELTPQCLDAAVENYFSIM